MAGDDLQGSGAVFGFEDLVALGLEILAGEMAEMGLIFDEENGLLSTIGAGKDERVLRRGGVFVSIGTREINTKNGAALRLAVDENKAAALFYDAVHGRKAQAGALGTLGA